MMVNKQLDEDKEITIRLNKRLYYTIVGMLSEKSLYRKKDIIVIKEESPIDKIKKKNINIYYGLIILTIFLFCVARIVHDLFLMVLLAGLLFLLTFFKSQIYSFMD